MEYVWYILAAAGAGIGTGLAGLSAATVMVPVLIVLCPSFWGEHGVYQATAIALASDILGSAVTAMTYIRHKNIDLKRGGIMLACIITMCVAGSAAAWLTGNVVLGSFTLFLTFFIGIRFLVKPETASAQRPPKGGKLTAKEAAVSLFFGLTIGFGTGYVGSGMMMLVVFTAFLGMDHKTAVGTSTFIMTFTALIASVSHIIIHPAILLEKWDVLLLCMAVATLASLYSARFANRVKSRTVSLVTGVVLTLLGAAMLGLNYREVILRYELAAQTLHAAGILVMCLIPCVLVLIPVRFLTGVKDHVFRKLLHIIAFSCFSVMIMAARSWPAAALCSLLIAAAAYPLLSAVEKEPWYGRLFVQKTPGEIKRSLLKLFFMFALVITIAWGVCGKPELATASIMMWGPGDAAAALVGIPYGRHKLAIMGKKSQKSWEGFFAGLIMAFMCGLGVLLYAGYPFVKAVFLALAGGSAGSAVEAVSASEADTVTVPLSILAVLLCLTAG